MMPGTHTYSLLDVPQEFFDLVKKRMIDAGYEHAINGNEIDMHGIALTPAEDDGRVTINAWRAQQGLPPLPEGEGGNAIIDPTWREPREVTETVTCICEKGPDGEVLRVMDCPVVHRGAGFSMSGNGFTVTGREVK